jgi:D-aminopeptidase
MTAPTDRRPRLRELGIIPGALPPGPHNAITDVPGVRVGHVTLIAGSGPLAPGRGPVRTGVTAVLPHEGHPLREKVPAAVHVINGAGEVTGRSLIDEWGLLDSPICLTNTLNVGLVYDAVVEWMARAPGGTGMVCHEFKGGIGTASRVAPAEGGPWTVGALVQANHGARAELRVAGLPAGRLLEAPLPGRRGDGSIIIVLATDAPLDAHQVRRLAARGALGLARTGSTARNGSGDFALAFSNARANRVAPGTAGRPRAVTTVPNEAMNPLFAAAVESVEEAILNALCAGGDMLGRDDHFVPGLPVEALARLWRERNPG